MWHGLFPYYLFGSVVYFIVPFLDLWLFYGRWFGPIDPSRPAMLDPVIHQLQHLLGWNTPVPS